MVGKLNVIAAKRRNNKPRIFNEIETDVGSVKGPFMVGLWDVMKPRRRERRARA